MDFIKTFKFANFDVGPTLVQCCFTDQLLFFAKRWFNERTKNIYYVQFFLLALRSRNANKIRGFHTEHVDVGPTLTIRFAKYQL